MDWQEQMITLYLFVCKHYRQTLSNYCQRMSNYTDLRFSDEEVITVYLFGIIHGFRTLKMIHWFADNYLRSWFPRLPCYVGLDQRLNQACDVFCPLIEIIQQQFPQIPADSAQGLIDSMPIVMAQRGRRFNAKVAPEIATSNGYCATKKMYYYGVKLHVAALRQNQALPVPQYIGLTNAGVADRKAYEQAMPEMSSCADQWFSDKAYQVQSKSIHKEYNIILHTPVKKEKGQKTLDAADTLLSKAISSIRQPIESLFNWINEKTGIQIASKVRSYKGLMVHVFGRLAAALFYLNCSKFSS